MRQARRRFDGGPRRSNVLVNVVVLGASDNPEKYSYLAVKFLKENGHTVFPVHPALKEIEGFKVYPSIKDIAGPIDTVSLYVSEEVSSKLAGDILSKFPKRIIFNPGAENPDLESKACQKGIRTLNACTLTMLKTHQF